MKKYILFVGMLSMINISFGFTCDDNGNAKDDTQKQPVCDQTPKPVKDYTKDMKHVLNLASGNKNKKKDVKGLGSKALDTSFGAYQSSEQVFTNFGTDYFSNFKILHKQQYINRDRNKVLKLKQMIQKKVSQAIEDDTLGDRIPESAWKQIDQYTKQKKSFLLRFKGNTYKELYNYLWTNQQAFESMYDNMVAKGKDDFKITKAIKEGGQAYGTITEHMKGLQKDLKKEYEPDGKKPSCDSDWEKTMKTAKEAVCKYGKKENDKTENRFQCNYSRLKKHLFHTNGGQSCGGGGNNDESKEDEKYTEKTDRLGAMMKKGNDEKPFSDKNDEKTKNLGTTSEAQKVNTDVDVTVEQRPDQNDVLKNTILSSINEAVNEVSEAHSDTRKAFTDADSGRFTAGITNNIVRGSKEMSKFRNRINNDNGKGNNDENNLKYHLTQTCRNQSPHVGGCE